MYDEEYFKSQMPLLYQYLMQQIAERPEMFSGTITKEGSSEMDWGNFLQPPTAQNAYENYWNVPGQGSINPGLRTGLTNGLGSAGGLSGIGVTPDYSGGGANIIGDITKVQTPPSLNPLPVQPVQPAQSAPPEYENMFSKEMIRELMEELLSGIRGLQPYQSKNRMTPVEPKPPPLNPAKGWPGDTWEERPATGNRSAKFLR